MLAVVPAYRASNVHDRTPSTPVALVGVAQKPQKTKGFALIPPFRA